MPDLLPHQPSPRLIRHLPTDLAYHHAAGRVFPSDSSDGGRWQSATSPHSQRRPAAPTSPPRSRSAGPSPQHARAVASLASAADIAVMVNTAQVSSSGTFTAIVMTTAVRQDTKAPGQAGPEGERDQQRHHDPARDGEHRRPDAAGGGNPQFLTCQRVGAGVGYQDQHRQADRGTDPRGGADDP